MKISITLPSSPAQPPAKRESNPIKITLPPKITGPLPSAPEGFRKYRRLQTRYRKN